MDFIHLILSLQFQIDFVVESHSAFKEATELANKRLVNAGLRYLFPCFTLCDIIVMLMS